MAQLQKFCAPYWAERAVVMLHLHNGLTLLYSELLVLRSHRCAGKDLLGCGKELEVSFLRSQSIRSAKSVTLQSIKYYCGLTPAKETTHGNPPIISTPCRDTVLYPLTTSRKPAEDGSNRLQTAGNPSGGAGECLWPLGYRLHLKYRPDDVEIETETGKKINLNQFTTSRVRKGCCSHEARGVMLFLGAPYYSADLSSGFP